MKKEVKELEWDRDAYGIPHAIVQSGQATKMTASMLFVLPTGFTFIKHKLIKILKNLYNVIYNIFQKP